MVESRNIRELFKSTVIPFIESKDFRFLQSTSRAGRVSNYDFNRSASSQYVHCVSVMVDFVTETFRLDLGVGLGFLIPIQKGNDVESAKPVTSETLNQFQCDFQLSLPEMPRVFPLRCVLPANRSDMAEWGWSFGINIEQMIRHVENAMQIFADWAPLFFDQFRDFPEPLISLSIADIARRSQLMHLGLPLEERLGLILARLHLYLGDKERASEYAVWTIKRIEASKVGSALLPILRSLRAGSLC